MAGAAERCLRALAGREGVQVAAISSLIEGLPELPEGIVHLRATFPMSRYYAAFDGAVSAAGYNAFHELIRFGVPSVFVPMPRETDDQAARARHAEATGLGVGVAGPDDPSMERRLEALLDAERRRAMRERLEELRPPNGAAEAARWLEDLVGDLPRRRRWPLDGCTPARGGLAALCGDAHSPRGRMGGERAANAVAAGWAGDLDAAPANPRRRRGRPRRGARAPRERRRSPRSPIRLERVLVVTDSLRIGALRALGVAVEQVPAAGERQPQLAGGDYESFLRRRLGLILAQRPRLRRAIAIGDVPTELLDAATARPRRRARLLR